MTTVYAIFREAVCRHECGGIFADLDRAKREAERLACEDGDSHHSYEVVPFELDEAVRYSEAESSWSRSLDEADPLYRVEQGDGRGTFVEIDERGHRK